MGVGRRAELRKTADEEGREFIAKRSDFGNTWDGNAFRRRSREQEVGALDVAARVARAEFVGEHGRNDVNVIGNDRLRESVLRAQSRSRGNGAAAIGQGRDRWQ